jgi:tetratricopeptide (TPR) repeat protein
MSGHLKKFILLLVLFSCQQTKKKLPTKIYENDNIKIQSLQFVADSLYKQNSYLEAIRYFDTLIKLDPRNGEFYYRRGFSYDMIYKKPELKEAIEDYLKSIELGYEKADSYYNLGLSYLFEEDSTALFYFEKSLEINPNNHKVIVLLEQCKKRLRNKHH